MFDFDPFAPRCWNDPYPFYEVLRSEHPVYRREQTPYYILSRYDDIVRALVDHETFSSAKGILIDTDAEKLPVNMMNMDPPRHDTLRGILTRAMTEDSIARLEPVFRELVVGLIEEFRPKGHFEVVGELSRALPSMVIAEVLGIERADRADFLRWNHAVNSGAEFVGEGALRAYEELEAYFKRVIAERKAQGTDDLVSRIFRGSLSEERLTDEEVLGFCSLLLVAGQHATISLLSNAFIELSRHPAQQALLRRRPELLRDGAVEELMRFISPVQGLARTTTRDVTLHGSTIPGDSQVLLLYASGNRDPERFDAPDTLDLTRPDDKTHLAFGHGIHYCLGNAVARLEIRIVFEEVLARLGPWSVDESSVERNQLIPGRGVACATVHF
jgi:cytochrome P450